MSTTPFQIGTPNIVGAPGLHDAITLADLKSYMSQSMGTQVPDVALQSLITGVSTEFLSETGLTGLAPTVRNEQRDTRDRAQVVLAHAPAIKFLSVTLNSLPVTQSPDGMQSGWVLDDSKNILSVVGQYRYQTWTRSIGACGYAPSGYNLQMSYIAGFGVYQIDSGVVPDSTAGYQIQVGQANWFVQDFGVTYANGTALVAVPYGATPAAGQYSVLPPIAPSINPQGVYQFAAADAGQTISISYTYKAIPGDIQLAVREWCAFRWQKRPHLAVNSEGVQGQTISYAKGKPDSVKDVLSRYRRALSYL